MRQNEWSPGDHPDLELLLGRTDGPMDTTTAAAVDAHLADCATCRLALKQARRFADLDRDDEAAAAAGWPAAAQRMDAAWQSRGRPAVLRPRRRLPRWLAPVAAAAVVAVVVFNLGQQRLVQGPGADGDSIRGGPVAAPVLTDLSPRGELAEWPDGFTWEASRVFDSYELELFTEDLAPVFTLAGLEDTRTGLPDSLRTLLEEGRTYFWHVQGHEGLADVEASETVWFRVTAPAEG